MSQRPLPWTALMEALGEQRLQDVHRALERDQADPFSRDGFLLNGTVGKLLRDLVPEDAPAPALTGYGALLHVLYLAWSRDWPVARPGQDALRAALAAPGALPEWSGPPAVCYVQLPERLVWAQSEPGGPHEPLDGAFVVVQGKQARVVAVLGLHPSRAGFTTMEAALELPSPAPARADGSPTFAPLLAGGERARLFSVATPDELAQLALLSLAAAQATPPL